MTLATIRRLEISTYTLIYCWWTYDVVHFWIIGNAAASGAVMGTILLHAIMLFLIKMQQKNYAKQTELLMMGHSVINSQEILIASLNTTIFIDEWKMKLMEREKEQLQRALKAAQADGEEWKDKS